MSVLQSLSTGSTFEGIHRSLITFRWPGRPVIGEQRFVSFGNFLELFLGPLRVILQDKKLAVKTLQSLCDFLKLKENEHNI